MFLNFSNLKMCGPRNSRSWSSHILNLLRLKNTDLEQHHCKEFRKIYRNYASHGFPTWLSMYPLMPVSCHHRYLFWFCYHIYSHHRGGPLILFSLFLWFFLFCQFGRDTVQMSFSQSCLSVKPYLFQQVEQFSTVTWFYAKLHSLWQAIQIAAHQMNM